MPLMYYYNIIWFVNVQMSEVAFNYSTSQPAMGQKMNLRGVKMTHMVEEKIKQSSTTLICVQHFFN